MKNHENWIQVMNWITGYCDKNMCQKPSGKFLNMLRKMGYDIFGKHMYRRIDLFASWRKGKGWLGNLGRDISTRENH